MNLNTFDTVEDSLKYVDYSLSGYDVYEFGVFNGNTLGRLIKGFREKGVECDRFFGFDSFCGLPAEDPNVWNNPEWPIGAFNVQNDYGLKSVDEAIDFVYNNLKSTRQNEDVRLIPGFFSETINHKFDGVAEYSMGNAQYIHVDTDIYLSSFEVLDFCFRNEIPVYGCLVRFDDIASTSRHAGQHLAWDKIKFKYEVDFEQLSYNVFRINGYK